MSRRPELDWVEHPDLIKFYSSERRRPSDLYPSESRFLPWLAAQSETVLDVGCASGGFADIWSHYSPNIKYTGVDASARLIEAASALHPESRFVRGDGAEPLAFADQCSDVVAALGWLHLEPRYREALPELWRIARNYLFFDVRLQQSSSKDLVGQQRLALVDAWDGHTTIPYIVAPWCELAEALLALEPARIFGYGYTAAPAPTVTDLEGPICFATFVLERGERIGAPDVALDLPLASIPGSATASRMLDDDEARP